MKNRVDNHVALLVIACSFTSLHPPVTTSQPHPFSSHQFLIIHPFPLASTHHRFLSIKTTISHPPSLLSRPSSMDLHCLSLHTFLALYVGFALLSTPHVPSLSPSSSSCLLIPPLSLLYCPSHPSFLLKPILARWHLPLLKSQRPLSIPSLYTFFPLLSRFFVLCSLVFSSARSLRPAHRPPILIDPPAFLPSPSFLPSPPLNPH